MSPSSSQPSRKEWRVVSEQSVRNTGNEELERSRLGQSDERLIYEVQHGREPVDVDFCSITIDGGLDNDILQQRLHAVAKQREELQQMEIELRAQVIARSEIVGMQNTFDTQLKEQANANIKLQEQLHEKGQKIHELERKLEETERELHAIRLDNEAAWAKEDLLREQSKELQSYRFFAFQLFFNAFLLKTGGRGTTEAERVQHIKQIHDLQEHIQEKDRQFMELQEQHRIAQETILYKDEQLREAQAWITRAQEMDALQSTTNHTLQAELRERTEHYNQLWLGCQRQFGEMERLHLHIQQLQLELASLREKSGSNLDGSHASQTNLKDASELGQSNDTQVEVNGNGSPGGNTGGLQNGNSEIASGGNPSTQADHVHGVAFAPSLLGMPTYIPPGQVAALHPFVMHQQGLPHPSHVMQSHLHSVPAMSSIQNWQNQHAQPDGQHVPTHDQEWENDLANYVDTNISRGLDADSVVASSNEEVLDSIHKPYDTTQSPKSLQQISSQFHDALRLDLPARSNGTKEMQGNPVSEIGMKNKSMKMEHPNLAVNASSSDAMANAKSFSETTTETASASSADLADGFLAQLDRGRIRISSTLPNRLAKMLAPLHWHDYKKKYGKLDDFVASHPELFIIEGDYIQLREGAQEIIAATAAVAKVAAAAAATPTSYPSLLPSVALTPMAQSHRLKKTSSLESSSVNADKTSFTEFAGPTPLNVVDHPSQFAPVQSQNMNGGFFHVAGGTSNVKILSKAKDHLEMNGSETRLGRSALLPVGNGTKSDKTDFPQSKGVSHGRPGVGSVGKQHSRAIGAASRSVLGLAGSADTQIIGIKSSKEPKIVTGWRQ
ncbi:UNVERIFIED_CONTAM: hypothetical protein Scaly_0534200 [Sesamum calycinum]|uniref:DUF7725 domain-containing protein n=1 Tax=Sesamum calycinum TaxID=2727403 RepID=A0AAW2RQU8_9LAMI